MEVNQPQDQNPQQLQLPSFNSMEVSDRVCRFYRNNGFCRYFDKCRYSHSPEKSNEERYVENRENYFYENRDNSPKFIHKKYSRKYSNVYGSNRYRQNSRIPVTRNTRMSKSVVNKSIETNITNETSTEQTDSVSTAHVSTTVERKSFRGMGRWTGRRGHRYFYSNFRFKSKNQRTKFSDYNYGYKTSNNINNEIQSQQSTLVMQDSVDTNSPHLIDQQNNSKQENILTTVNLHETEIRQLKKRFPTHQIVDEKHHIYYIEYSPTDPDWSFTVTSIKLKVEFPPEYPTVPFLLTILNEEHCLPELLVKHLNKMTKNWISERIESNIKHNKTELIFRPFLRWLDKNLEDMFIYGLRLVKQDIDTKAAGIECIPYEMLCNSLKTEEAYSSDENNVVENATDSVQHNEQSVSEIKEINVEDSTLILESDEIDEVATDTQKLNITDQKSETLQPLNISGSRTEIKFKDFCLSDNAGTLTCRKLQFTIQCIRCKSRHDLSVPAQIVNVAICSKCHQKQEVRFQPSMLHSNSSIAGYIHLSYCQIIDLPLVSCEFAISCLSCSRQASITGIHYAQQRLTWCHYCNSKMSVFIQGVRFLELQPSGIQEKNEIQIVKLNSKLTKNTVLPVQPGKPLPDNGTCKHYKKSFRWLRFPCCGKAYPCDICHNEKEIDHEMKYATRMICGFCAREQPYTKDKECISCSSYVTKKSGAHWEGGQGCRDRMKMSRLDKQKYSGINKTKRIKKVSAKLIKSV